MRYIHLLILFVYLSFSVGSPTESEEMLKLVSEKNLKPWYQTYPMNQVNNALEDVRAGKPRFRFVLKN
jgi:D-arabinose 1-dehydrogenase-like Zn-dependent alcohol dehydrogenase